MTSKDDYPTLRDLKVALRNSGFVPSKARGQNFLFDHNILRSISGEVAALPDDIVLEIGPGSGFLTMHLAQTAGRVLGVEVDGTLSSVSKRFLGKCENVEIMTADILQKGSINTAVLRRIGELGGCSLAVGNLPYSAATAIVSAIAGSDLKLRRMVFLVQEEVARRLTASHGDPDYCAGSVITAASFDTELLQRIGPSVFWPRPKVNSRLVRFRPAPKVSDPAGFALFVHTLFARPKKTAVNSFLEGLSRTPTGTDRERRSHQREAIIRAIQSIGMDPRVRPGRLAFEQIEALHKKLVPEILKSPSFSPKTSR